MSAFQKRLLKQLTSVKRCNHKTLPHNIHSANAGTEKWRQNDAKGTVYCNVQLEWIQIIHVWLNIARNDRIGEIQMHRHTDRKDTKDW